MVQARNIKSAKNSEELQTTKILSLTPKNPYTHPVHLSIHPQYTYLYIRELMYV